MNWIVQYQWEIFIVVEVISILSLLSFGVVRYLLAKARLSFAFLFAFVVLLVIEAILAFVIYRETGEFSTFQMVIIIFLIYACTFGIADFKKLDRWMKLKIGKWRGIDLLKENDKYKMKREKDPKYIAKKYRYSSIIHLLVFIIAQFSFLYWSLDNWNEVKPFLTDLSWIGSEHYQETPYSSEVLYGISMIWGIVFIIDFIYSWSYTIFPSK